MKTTRMRLPIAMSALAIALAGCGASTDPGGPTGNPAGTVIFSGSVKAPEGLTFAKAGFAERMFASLLVVQPLRH